MRLLRLFRPKPVDPRTAAAPAYREAAADLAAARTRGDTRAINAAQSRKRELMHVLLGAKA